MANESSQLLGQETELAISFQSDDDYHPGNKVIFDYMARAIRSIVKTKPGKRNFIQDQFFVQNGGAIYYEHHPQSLKRGLIECATPECKTASELVLYQRAQEALLQKAIPIAESLMSYDGIDGELKLLKNCRDFEGNTYGSQENYDSNLSEGFHWWAFVALNILYVPFALVFKVLYIFLLIPFIFFVFTLKFLAEFAQAMSSFLPFKSLWKVLESKKSFRDLLVNTGIFLSSDSDDSEESLLKIEYMLFYPLFWLSYKPLILIYNTFAFRRQREQIHSHVISRIVFTGAGSLVEEGRFILSEKSLAINCFLRRSIHRMDKPLFDCGNLIKEYELAIWSMFLLRFQAWKSIFRKQQRLQIAFSDSNRCHLAEFLKVGTSSLVVRMANAGFISEAPVLEDPISSLHAMTKDIELQGRYRLESGEAMSAIEIQRWYCDKAREFLDRYPSDMEDHEIVKVWDESLGLLESSPESLIGRIDWITKKHLLDSSGADLDFWARKKIDLKYHELGTGYFETLQKQGMTLDLFEESQIEEAVFEPSSPKRVKVRSRLIRSISLENVPMTISWGEAKLGRWKPKVLSLSSYRDERKSSS